MVLSCRFEPGIYEKSDRLVKPIRDKPERPIFNKRAEFFVGVHDEPLSVAAMRVNNPDRSPLRIHG